MTHHVPAELQNYVRQSIIPQYANFDKAHQIDHVEKVIEESLKLATYYEVDYSMVYVIAAYHDLGLYEGREFHHITSGKVLLADETLRRWFTDEQLLQMKEAIEDHRASNKQAPRTIYGMIVAEADRIIDPEVTLRRTVQYGLSHYPEMDKEQQYERFRKHLADKYAEGGLIGNVRYSSNPLQNSDSLNYINETLSKAPRGNNEFSEGITEDISDANDVPVKADQEDGGRKTEVSVNVTLNPTFQINGSSGNEADVVRIVRAHMRELADEIGGELAERLEMVFSNMPVRGEA